MPDDLPDASAALPTIDIAVIVVYILGIVAFGAFFLRHSRTMEGFTVGSRSLPGWAIGISILGTYVSSVSFLANPGKSYAGNWTPFVFGLALPVSCWIASRWFIPLYRSKLQTTAYEHLEQRFGYWARAYSGVSLILLQIGRIGVVLYLVSLAMNSLLGWDIVTLIFVLGILTIFYTVLGGIEAVIWTDVVQTLVLLGGAFACLVLLVVDMPGGMTEAFEVIERENKLSLGGFRWDLAIEGFWVVFIFGIIDNLRNFGVDQNYVQRFISAKSEREARKSLWLGGLSFLPVSAMFFAIGTLLFAYYRHSPPEGPSDQIFSYFIVRELPVGVTGIVVAAILAAGMSTLDSSINVSATVWVIDFYKRIFRPDASEQSLLTMTRISTVIIGIIGIGASLLMIQAKQALDTWWEVSGIFGGGMLGIFLLGILVPWATVRDAVRAVVAGVLVISWGTFCQDLDGDIEWLEFPFHKFLIGPVGTATILLVGGGGGVGRWLITLIAGSPTKEPPEDNA